MCVCYLTNLFYDHSVTPDTSKIPEDSGPSLHVLPTFTSTIIYPISAPSGDQQKF